MTNPAYSLLSTLPHQTKDTNLNGYHFGLNVSQDLFQEAMDEITKDLNGVLSIADDICVYGANDTEHDMHLHKLCEKARSYGLVFNPEKCFIRVPEISFFGL